MTDFTHTGRRVRSVATGRTGVYKWGEMVDGVHLITIRLDGDEADWRMSYYEFKTRFIFD